MSLYKEEQRDGEWVPVRTTLEELAWGDVEGEIERWHVSHEIGPYTVSTVFLSVTPQYETMVFCGDDGKDWEHIRYNTRTEAMKGHAVVSQRWQDVFESNVAALGAGFWEKSTR
jgi:hypothetical protein